MTALGIGIVTASVLLLSAAGIYALMSFTVERRRREIGIRMALGADRSRVVRNIFARAFGQLAIGVGIGIVLAPVFLRLDGPITLAKVVTLFAVSGVMLIVGLLASVGPTRRSLRIQPTEALKDS
jgi:ABC-type antimicrobial peptide transport system permease subunit